MENLKIYLVKISRVKITISLFAVSILAITIVSFSPFDANADYDKITIPEISGTITISESVQNYTNESKIALSVAMAVAENSVEKGKAMWGKLDVVQGFLIYKIGILTSDDIFHKVIVDAGNGQTLYISEGISKNDWKHSEKKSSNKWKEHYSDLTPEERDVKKQQWGEVKDAFFALTIEERAKMIIHFISMKAQWEILSDEDKEAKKMEMKHMMEDLLPLSVEEKTQKLREYIISFQLVSQS